MSGSSKPSAARGADLRLYWLTVLLAVVLIAVMLWAIALELKPAHALVPR